MRDPNFNRFSLIHPWDGQTDGWTDGQTDGFAIAYSALSMLSRAKKVKERIAVNGTPSHSYGTPLAIWDHTVLPATCHK